MALLRRQENVRGKIQSIKGNLIIVSLFDEQTEAKACAGAAGCDSGCGACSGIENNKVITIFTKQAKEYAPGNVITFNYRSVNDIIMLLFAFGIPFICGGAVAYLWYVNAPAKFESPQSILSIVGAFCAGFGIIWIIDNVLRQLIPAQITTPSIKK